MPMRSKKALSKAPRQGRASVLLASIIGVAYFCSLTGALLAPAQAQQKKRPPGPRGSASSSSTARPTSSRGLTITTEPNALIWMDELRRGVADAAGQLMIARVPPGRHTLRVRAAGFAERTLALPPGQRGRLAVRLTRTTDEAELVFQQAEEAREKSRTDEARQQAAELYRRALALRPRFPAAHLGLARTLLDLNDPNAALDQIEAARRFRPAYPEASAVEGRILRAAADHKAAIEAYRRAIREARGFQPEAYAGMGILLEEQGKYAEAVAAFQKAITQLDETEPALYQLIGAAYERLEKYKEAVAAYEHYLRLAPEGSLAPAIRSIIDQLRQQAAEQAASPN